MTALSDKFSSDAGLQELIDDMKSDVKLQRLVLNIQPGYRWVEEDGTVREYSDDEIERVWKAIRAVDVSAVIALNERERSAAEAVQARLRSEWPRGEGSLGEDWFHEMG